MSKKSLIGMILAIVGLILGVVGIWAAGITSWIGIVLCIVGLILSATGTKPFKIIGIIVAVIGIVVGLIFGFVGTCTACAKAVAESAQNGSLDDALTGFGENLVNDINGAIESGLNEVTGN